MAERALDLIEARLAGREWLEGGRLTIADLACAPYVALAPQGGMGLAQYPRIRAWIDRIAGMPRFPGMPGWSVASGHSEGNLGGGHPLAGRGSSV